MHSDQNSEPSASQEWGVRRPFRERNGNPGSSITKMLDMVLSAANFKRFRGPTKLSVLGLFD
jgi:hypothetical protein